jgi:acetolactate synthase-1/2/3 large subunit
MLSALSIPAIGPEWSSYVTSVKARYYGKETSTSARRLNSLSPYEVVRVVNAVVADDAVVIGDTGAAICWLHQAFKVKRHNLFTAGGNSPMGYSLPAAIGAKVSSPDRQVVCYIGDGGFQLNIHDLQTIVHHNLPIVIVVMNNSSYGIIKQFQDSYLDSRYTASRDGYSAPDFGRLAAAYGLKYARVEGLEQILPSLFESGSIIIDVVLSEDTLIEPKLEMGRPINDQFPYLPDDEYALGNQFVPYPR